MPKIRVAYKLNAVGVTFILDNLKNQKMKENSPDRAKQLSENAVREIIMSEEKIKSEFSNRVHYEYDPNNSHSSLLVEGLLLKFSNTFFE